MVDSLSDKTFGERVPHTEWNTLINGVQDVYPSAEREIVLGNGIGSAPVKRQIPVIDVTHPPFNAAGDGTTDDTQAILDALAEAASSGAGTYYSTAQARRLYFPPGIYGISQHIDFSSGGQWLSVMGDGPAVSIFKALHANAKLSFANARTSIGGFTFEGNALATVGIVLNPTSTTRFRDIYVRGCAGNGIETHNLQNCILDNIGSQYNGGSGFVVDDGTGSCDFRRLDLHSNVKHQLLITESDAVASGYPQPTHNSFVNCLLEFPILAATGTASAGGSTTTLVHTGAGWTTNQWAGAYVTKNPGGGAQQGARIISNTATVLTVETGMWSAAPDALVYRIHWPICRVDASDLSIFENMILGSGELGEYPILHVTRRGGTEQQSTVILRNSILTGSATYHTGIEVNGAAASVDADSQSIILGAKLGIRYTDGAGSRLKGSLPSMQSVTTPITFVSGSFNNNGLDIQNGILKRITSYATTDATLRHQVNGEANFRFQQLADGRLDWGDGTAAVDVSLRRGGANWLFTDDSFTTALAMWSRAIVAKTANYTTVQDDQVILADATSGAVTITLPSVAITGKVITVKRTNSAANNVIVSRAGSATIDGATTKTITTQYGFLTVVADGTNWSIISSGGTIT